MSAKRSAPHHQRCTPRLILPYPALARSLRQPSIPSSQDQLGVRIRLCALDAQSKSEEYVMQLKEQQSQSQ